MVDMPYGGWHSRTQRQGDTCRMVDMPYGGWHCRAPPPTRGRGASAAWSPALRYARAHIRSTLVENQASHVRVPTACVTIFFKNFFVCVCCLGGAWQAVVQRVKGRKLEVRYVGSQDETEWLDCTSPRLRLPTEHWNEAARGDADDDGDPAGRDGRGGLDEDGGDGDADGDADGDGGGDGDAGGEGAGEGGAGDAPGEGGEGGSGGDGAADSKDGGDASASWKVHSGLRDRVEGGGVR